MKATIYALVDPNTNQVRYVGRTRQTPEQRLAAHLKPGNNSHPVYAWMRSLQPALPVLVILQEGISTERKSSGTHRAGTYKQWTPDDRAEVKWMKRFERSPLLCSIPRDTDAYRTLVNPPGVKCKRK